MPCRGRHPFVTSPLKVSVSLLFETTFIEHERFFSFLRIMDGWAQRMWTSELENRESTHCPTVALIACTLPQRL